MQLGVAIGMDFTQPFDYSDVTFTIEGQKVYANKAVLGMSSEVFRSMFKSAFREKMMAEIPIQDKKFDDFLQLMQIVHPPHTKCVDATNVHSILPLAHEYQIIHVYENCVKILMDTPPSLLTLNLADKYNLTQLHNKCLQYAMETPLLELKNTEGFTAMDSQTLIDVLTHKVEQLEEPADLRQRKAVANGNNEKGMCAGTGHVKGTEVTCLACIQYADHF